ncbi:hypothetical protein [Polluticaenibacter yanchengensis]|uniref:DUF4878 domain-containing protein n=1 Tax=Polluticaenibacter yanchengensis TaxID=3014562 RepID=A0ABT4UPA1_9BACT|nr:hypothetical protein [Chitinophagaceae bacterium LY-5]
MKRLGIFCLGLLVMSCNGGYTKPENAIDGARIFIDATYKGDFKKAKFFMIDNEANKTILDKEYAEIFRAKNAFEKDDLRKDNIEIVQILTPNAEEVKVIYNNKYHKQVDTLTMVKDQDFWKADLTK